LEPMTRGAGSNNNSLTRYHQYLELHEHGNHKCKGFSRTSWGTGKTFTILSHTIEGKYQ
jgi:hypothetical protein